MEHNFIDRREYKNKPVSRELYQKARDEVLTKLTIPEYFRDNIDPTIDLTRNPRCLCPFHEEDTPSFRYKGDENYWRCFGKCQDGGTVIELHMRKFGIKNHYEGLWHLKQIYGKKYGLSFKNFFITNDNKDLTIEDILKKPKKAMTMEEFLKPKQKSLTGITNKIEDRLKSLKYKDRKKFIEASIMYDNLYVYKMNDVENMEKFLNYLERLSNEK